MTRSLVLALLLFGAVGAAAREIASPAGPGGVHPFLSATNGRLRMSWTEPAGKEYAVKVASFEKGTWSAPSTVVQRGDLFVNWADFPSVVATKDGTLFAHWLQKSSAGTYSYDVRVASSRDGRKWGSPRVVHRDATPTEHGFVSMVPVRDDAVALAWLDGREMKGGHGGEMTLRYARVDAAGRMAREDLLDRRVCECCATGMAFADAGPVIVYRDRSSEEVRDISSVRWRNGRWTKPTTVHADGWKIEGCPVNGPQIEARGERVAVVWFTAAEQNERVFLAFSSDGGASFGAPVRIDGGDPSGRVDLILLADDSAVVTWLEGEGEQAHIAVRRIRPDGTAGLAAKVAGSSTARGAGFPRIAVHGDELFVAWTETSTPRRIRIEAVPLPR